MEAEAYCVDLAWHAEMGSSREFAVSHVASLLRRYPAIATLPSTRAREALERACPAEIARLRSFPDEADSTASTTTAGV